MNILKSIGNENLPYWFHYQISFNGEDLQILCSKSFSIALNKKKINRLSDSNVIKIKKSKAKINKNEQNSIKSIKEETKLLKIADLLKLKSKAQENLFTELRVSNLTSQLNLHLNFDNNLK